MSAINRTINLSKKSFGIAVRRAGFGFGTVPFPCTQCSRCFSVASDQCSGSLKGNKSTALDAFLRTQKEQKTGMKRDSFFLDAASKAMEASAASNVTLIADTEQFMEFLHNDPAVPNVILYGVSGSNSSMTLLEQFVAAASQSPAGSVNYLIVDMDKTPRAAYQCMVEDSPTIYVCYKVDAYFKKIARVTGDEPLETMISDMRIALDCAQKAAALGAESRTAWYTHNIPLDNLNVHRVHWPTA